MDYHGYKKDFEEVIQRFNFDYLRGKSILITGGTGLIGLCLVELLLYLKKEQAYDNTVYVLVRSVEAAERLFGPSSLEVEFIEGDIRSVDITTVYFDYIIHAASIANPASYVELPVDVIDTTVAGVKNVLEYCRNNPETRLINVSTVEVVGSLDIAVAKEEDQGVVDLLTVRSSYPEAKRLAEVYCRAYISQYNANVIIARPVKVYGRYNSSSDKRAIAYMQQCVARDENITLQTKAEAKFSFCYVVDTVTALVVLLQNGVAGEVYTIANTDSYESISFFAETIASAVNLRVEYDIKESNRFSKNVNNTNFDNTKLLRAGWRPYVGLEEGIRRIVESAQANRK